MTGAPDAQKLKIQTARLGNQGFVARASGLDCFGFALSGRQMPVLAVDVVEQLLAHKAVIRLRRAGFDGVVFVEVEAGHAPKIERLIAVQPNQFLVNADGRRAGRQPQHGVGFGAHQFADARGDGAAHRGVIGVKCGFHVDWNFGLSGSAVGSWSVRPVNLWNQVK